MENPTRGGCACGHIQYEITADPVFTAICHCTDCQRASGGTGAVVTGIPKDGFAVLQGTVTGFEHLAESQNKLTRNFCPKCGSRLFTDKMESFPDLVFVAIGNLEEPARFEPVMEIFTKSRLPWMPARDSLAQFEGMPG